MVGTLVTGRVPPPELKSRPHSGREVGPNSGQGGGWGARPLELLPARRKSPKAAVHVRCRALGTAR
eukprot:8761791-Alexandrium_andersonii.AAC.1